MPQSKKVEVEVSVKGADDVIAKLNAVHDAVVRLKEALAPLNNLCMTLMIEKEEKGEGVLDSETRRLNNPTTAGKPHNV